MGIMRKILINLEGLWYWFTEGGYLILISLGVAFFIFLLWLMPNKEKKERVEDPRLYLDMVYLINCEGVAYDSAIVDYYRDSDGVIDFRSYDDRITYSGSYLIKELPESYEEPYIREVMRRREAGLE